MVCIYVYALNMMCIYDNKLYGYRNDVYKPKCYMYILAICMYDMYDMDVDPCISDVLFRFHIVVGSSFRLGGVGSVSSKVRGTLSVLC